MKTVNKLFELTQKPLFKIKSIDFEIHHPGDLIFYFTDMSGGSHPPTDGNHTIPNFISEKEFNRLDLLDDNILKTELSKLAKRIKQRFKEFSEHKMTLKIHGSNITYKF